MKLKKIQEEVLSTDVGNNVLHHGALMALVRRPSLMSNLISFDKKKKKKKRKKNEA
jgi:hypothetical protein